MNRSLNGEEVDILFVEDDHAFRTHVAEHLRNDGLQVAEAENGLRALEYLHAGNRPGLMIIDLLMPEMDGFQLTMRLRNTPQFSEIPILIVSGTARTLSTGGPHGVVHHLMKPFAIEQLIASARRIIGKTKG